MDFSDILLLQIILMISLESSTSWPMKNENFTLPSNCLKTCGDIQIEYPFGIGTDCSYAVGFNLTCSHDWNHTRLLLGDGNIQVRSFYIEEGLVIIESPYVTLNVDAQFNKTALINLKDLPLSLISAHLMSSPGYNRLHVAGCSAIAAIVDLETNTVIDACTTICFTVNTSTTEQGYCRLELDSVRYSKLSWAIELNRFNENIDHMTIDSTSSIIATIYNDDFTNDDDFQSFIDHRNRTGIMASLTWYFNDHSTCKEAMKKTNTYACRSDESECYDVYFEDAPYYNETIGYNCRCSSKYSGNPYLPGGCKLGKNVTFSPAKDCQNKCGNVTIPFPFGLKQGCYREEYFALTCNETSHPPTLLFGYSAVSKISVNKGQLELSYHPDSLSEQRVVGRRQDMIYYYDSPRVSYFTLKEQETVTNWVIGFQSCNDARKDNATFACIHEHSSCLDVKNEGYRCICNRGYDGNPYLPGGCQDESKLSWDDRLRIATESAGAFAYLHSAASMSIFHRDVKSSNILLDDAFKAKVSDFGASRFIPFDQTHIVTAIHGTFGYIDPEYYQTSRLIEKSDVYSFGIILLELLTGKKPIYLSQNGLQQNLAMNFLQAIRENSFLDLLEDHILQEGTKQEFLEISSLIEICLNLKGAKRPTMKEVEYKLQTMRKTKMEKNGVCILEGIEETECLLTASSHSSSELLNQISQGNSRNYSFENELMWSQNCAW